MQVWLLAKGLLPNKIVLYSVLLLTRDDQKLCDRIRSKEAHRARGCTCVCVRERENPAVFVAKYELRRNSRFIEFPRNFVMGKKINVSRSTPIKLLFNSLLLIGDKQRTDRGDGTSRLDQTLYATGI